MNSIRSAVVMTLLAAVAVPGHSSRMARSATSSLPSIVMPIRSADVAAQVDGDVARLFVQEGDAVMAGQLLARVNDRIPQAQVNVARAAADCEADRVIAEGELRQARRLRDRTHRALARGAVSAAEGDRVDSECELAEARVMRATEECRQRKMQLELEKARLHAHSLVAAFDGDVLRIDQQVGNAVGQGIPVLRIADLTRLKAVVFVPFEWFDELCPGQTVLVTASAPVNRLVEAQVTSVEPVIDAATETFRCVVEIDNHDRSLPSGFSVVLEQEYVTGPKMAAKETPTPKL